MNTIYVACDWTINPEGLLVQPLLDFLEAVSALNGELWVDWRGETPRPSLIRLLLQLPSHECLSQLMHQASNLELTNWRPLSHENFVTIVEGGQVSSLHKIKRGDGGYISGLHALSG